MLLEVISYQSHIELGLSKWLWKTKDGDVLDVSLEEKVPDLPIDLVSAGETKAGWPKRPAYLL